MDTLSCSSTGMGMTATIMSEMIVTMAYAVKDGPEGRQVPGLMGSHDLCTGWHARISVSAHPRWPTATKTMAAHTTMRYSTWCVPLSSRW
jgi:hypothetical protein